MTVSLSLFGRFRVVFTALLGLLSLVLLPALAAGQGIPLNQVASSPSIVYQSAVSLAYPAPQQTGGLNVVIVGWNDSSSTITSVTDTAGNTYFLAAGTMNATAPDVSQAIYVAANIKGGPNVVTVAFDAYTSAQDVRLIEYGGPPFLENTTFPFDTWVGGTGTISPASTGPLTTTYATDVLVVSGTISTGFTSVIKSCGTGCTLFTEIPPTAPFDDITADTEVTALGTYNGEVDTAGGGGGNWVLQMVALRVAGQATIVNPAPTAVSVLPATSPEAGGVAIAITGTGFLAGANVTVTDGTHTASAINCVVASATVINCVTPVFPTNTTPTLVVTNPDSQAAAPLAFAYTASTPFNTVAGGVNPGTGSTNGGTPITITGSDFASGAEVFVGGIRADEISVVNSSTITAVVPAGPAGAQTVTVTNPSKASGSLSGAFTYASGAGINFVQANSAQVAGSTGSVAAAFKLAQTAGDLNVVVIGWGDATGAVQSVTDGAGNTYAVAVGATQGTGLTQAIYYAKNINASGSNTVTVNFVATAANPDLRIVEYSGLDTASPLDGGVGASGTGAFVDSGPITPTGVGDMILGASTVGGAITQALGKACADNSCLFATAIFTPGGNNVEHAFPTVAGPFDATGNQTPSTVWVTQVAAFKQPTGVVADFGVAATPLSPVSVAAGSSATSTVTVTPSGGFTSAVVLTCTGLPTGAACNFVPPSVTPGASAVTSALTITTMSTTPVGSSPVTITGTSGSLNHSTTVTLVVTAAGAGNFTLTASPASQTVSPGGTGTSTITINPTGGFTGTVTMACSVTPTPSLAPICSVGAVTTTATLTVTTTAATAALRHSTSIYYAALLPLFGMTLLGVSFGSRRKKVLGVLLVFLMVSGLLFLAACGGSSSSTGGGGSPGTPAGNYTVTVTGTSGSLTPQTTTFTLTVN